LGKRLYILGNKKVGKRESNRKVSCRPDVYWVCPVIDEKMCGFFTSGQLN
jgi:hypothetical protein